MGIDEIEKAIQLMEDSGEEILSTGSASESLIEQAEVELGVHFPEDYKYFLKKFGSLCFEAEEFYGLTKLGLKADSVPCVIFVTKSARERGDISNKMLKVKSSGYGPIFSIDLSRVDQGIAPVIQTELSYKRTGEVIAIANSFGEFFLNEITNAIEDL